MSSFRLAGESSSLSLSPNFILPEDKRPQLPDVSTLTSIPLIDLEDAFAVQKVSQACEEYGFFQITNHGVPHKLCSEMMTAAVDFFDLAPEIREQFLTTDYKKQVKLCNYHLKAKDGSKINMWSECFSHHWDLLDDFIPLLPEKVGTQYRYHTDAFVEYAKEIGSLMGRLLGMISEGLGLEKDCLKKMLGEKPILKAQSNFYPPCPDPELTLGLPVHTDPNALTLLQQSEGVSGLQVIKDGKWVSVPALSNAFVVNLGDQIQVLSNGRYKSVHHRAVTNKVHTRVAIAMFYGPNMDAVIGPIKDLIDEKHPPKYQNYRYAEFLEQFLRQEGVRRRVLEVFQLPN